MVKNLNKNQQKKLRERQKLRPADRANLDYKMAKKLESELDGLEGLLYIMNKIPPNKLKKGYIRDEHVNLLLQLTESALRILEYKKVRGDTNYPYVLRERNKEIVGINYRTGEGIKRGELYRDRATKKEIERTIMLRKHVDCLIKYHVPITFNGVGWSYHTDDIADMQMEGKEEPK